jgi:multiple sugar transport system permease protein
MRSQVERLSLEEKNKRFFVLCMAPALTLLFVFFVYLFGKTVWMSFRRFDMFLNTSWVGFANYKRAVSDPHFWRATLNNIVYTVAVVTVSFALGFVMALLVWRKSRLNNLIKPLFTLPMLFIPASAALLWTFMYSREFGLVNDFLSVFGFERIGWLSNLQTMFAAVMLTDIWAWTPFTFLMLYAGLQSLPVEPFEAAQIDGANGWQQFRLMTIPLLKPVIVITLALKGITTFRTFDYIWIMTAGGPNGITDVLSSIIYKTAFLGYRYGLASAMSLLQLPVALPFILFYAYSLIGKKADRGGGAPVKVRDRRTGAGAGYQKLNEPGESNKERNNG